MEASLEVVDGHPAAHLLGNKIVLVKDGWANFTNLGISHAGYYKYIYNTLLIIYLLYPTSILLRSHILLSRINIILIVHDCVINIYELLSGEKYKLKLNVIEPSSFGKSVHYSFVNVTNRKMSMKLHYPTIMSTHQVFVITGQVVDSFTGHDVTDLRWRVSTRNIYSTRMLVLYV